MDEILQVQLEDHAGVPVVHASGEVDVSTAPALRAELLGLPEDAERVVVDLTDVTFLDSTGLGVLVAAKRHFGEEGPGETVHVVVTRPQVRKVLEVTGLNTIFAIHPSLDEALGS